MDAADVERYFTGLRRAQRDIDFEPERYKHYWLREMPDDIKAIVDVRRFGPGERIVPEPYTREMFEQTHRWMRAWDLFDPGAATRPNYGEAVLARACPGCAERARVRRDRGPGIHSAKNITHILAKLQLGKSRGLRRDQDTPRPGRLPRTDGG